jgi:hypothetical protein
MQGSEGAFLKTLKACQRNARGRPPFAPWRVSPLLRRALPVGRTVRVRQLSRAAAGGQNVVPLKRRKQLGVIPLFRSGR